MSGRRSYFYPKATPLPEPRPALGSLPPRPEAEDYDWTGLRPLGSWLLVRRSRGQETSPGGILLPDRWADCWTEAEVLAAGPGRSWTEPNGDRHTHHVWTQPGDRVIFQAHCFRQLSAADRVGMVRDDDLVGFVDELGDADDTDAQIVPLNEWCAVRQDETPLSSGAIALPEEWAPRPMSGRLMAMGQGRLLRHGPNTGYRLPVPAIWGYALEQLAEYERFLGARVHWGATCEVLAVGRQQLEYCLVRAEDLELMDDDWPHEPGADPGPDHGR